MLFVYKEPEHMSQLLMLSYLYFRPSLSIPLDTALGFPANETFRKKIRKFSFRFRKLVHKNFAFFREKKLSENEAKNFAKCEIFVKTISITLAQKNL